jgi:putative SOS response-associated peptidase YedK
MCGRFSLKTTPDTLERIFGHAAPPGYRPRYNVAPTQEVLAIVASQAPERLAMLRWGLIPFWAKDPSIGNKLINARCESIQEKPAYRNAFRERRCVVLADGFYEWQRQADGKHPMWIRPPGGEPFAIAGLWERWGRGDEWIVSCTILTTGANPFMQPIHDRMPVILGEVARRAWLSEGAEETDLFGLLAEAQDVELRSHEVSTLVNNPANDLPECVDPVEPEPEPLMLGIFN